MALSRPFKEDHLAIPLSMPLSSSSVQFKMVSVCHSKVSPTLPLKQFQGLSDWQWPTLVLSRKIVQSFLFPHLSSPGDWWCDALGFLPAGSGPSSFWSSTTQAPCDGCFAFQYLSLSLSLSLSIYISAWPFPFTLACPGQDTKRSFQRWTLTIDTFQSAVCTAGKLHFITWLAAVGSMETQMSKKPD